MMYETEGHACICYRCTRWFHTHDGYLVGNPTTHIMNYSEALKKAGYSDDLCIKAILEHFYRNGYTITNKLHKDNLARVPLKAWKARKNDWERFSIDTILRKARLLASIGFLQKDNLGSRHSTRYWVESATGGNSERSRRPPQVRIEMREGRRVAVYV